MVESKLELGLRPSMDATPWLGESGRIALLSISLSSWIEGSAQLRSAFFMAMADVSPSTSPEYLNSPDWRVNLIQWLARPSRELDNSERGAQAILELAVRSFISSPCTTHWRVVDIIRTSSSTGD